MKKAFDMELFLSGILTGSLATRRRHVRQAIMIQSVIAKRWKLENPWSWRSKHLQWFLRYGVEGRSEATIYYFSLTAKLIALRLARHRSLVERKLGPHLKKTL